MSKERKDHRFLNRPSLKSMLHHRPRPAPPPPYQDREYGRGRHQQGESRAATMDKGSYLRVREQDDREETSSGSSSHSGSPGGGERSAGVSKDAEERGEEEEEGGRKAEGRRGIRHGYTGSEGASEVGVASNSTPSSSSRGYVGRSDSLGRGQKLNYPHNQLKRYPSNDSMSSSSTLVSKLNYEHDDNLADILCSATGRQGLTQSNVQDHLQSEARKTKYSRQYYRSRRHDKHQHQRPQEDEGGYGYLQRREKFMEDQENGDRAGSVERGGKRRGKKEEEEEEEEAGGDGE